LLSGSRAGEKEIELIKLLKRFTATIAEAAALYSPALVANYCYELSKEYNQFYHDFSILGEPDPEVRNLRLCLSLVTSEVIGKGMWLMGIEMPERM
jgi:arginyl-tRNA synthetase